MQAQLMTATPILEVFVHEDESDDPQVLAKVFDDRSRKHARNAYWMLFDPDQLSRRAGQGVRQGFGDAGPLTSARSSNRLGLGMLHLPAVTNRRNPCRSRHCRHRTYPIGRAFKGSLVDMRPDDLTALVVRTVLAKLPELDPRASRTSWWAATAGRRVGFNVARVAALLAGLPNVPA